MSATTATPPCSNCERTRVTHAGGDRWQCPKCGLAIGRAGLREWAIRHMINLGRFGDPVGASNEEWRKW